MVDISKLRTITNYSKEMGIPKATVQYKVKNGTLKSVKIEGKSYVVKP